MVFEQAFLQFCDSSKKGSTTATDKTLKKILTDAGILNKKMTMNDTDIEFAKFLGKGKKDVDYVGFMRFINEFFIPAYAKRNDIHKNEAEKIVMDRLKTSTPQGHGTTSVSKDGATERLTDVKGYTGAHKERFDAETGQGKGKEGRENITESTGYVSGYKGANSYDKEH